MIAPGRSAALALFLAAALAGCKDTDSNGDRAVEPAGPPPVSEAEERRGIAACNDYQERVCGCAESDPELADDCRMAGSRLDALELSLRIAAADGEGEGESGRAAALANARRVMQRCIEQAAELAAGCPARAPAEAP